MQNSIVYANGKDWISFIKKLEESKIITAETADKGLAEIGKAGREIITREEDKVFEMGKLQSKGYMQPPKVYSYFDSKTGGWKSKSKGYRLSGFKFESAAYSRRMGIKYKAISEGKIYSNLSNLWDKPTKEYKAEGSPYFHSQSYGTWGRWRGGASRPNEVRGKSSVTWSASDVKQVIGSAMSKAGNTMMERLQKEFNT